MSFNYDAIRGKKQSGETQWAAYSDLFMVLAFIFLLMYMVASLRTGMISVTTHAQIEDVKQELKLYESVKNQYLEEKENLQEKKVYQEILGQITLLETQAAEKKNQAEQQYNTEKKRESSLNQYQQMIVAMINANAIAKAEAAKKFTSAQQQQEQMRQEVEQKSQSLASLEGKFEKEQIELSDLKQAHAAETQNLEGKFQALKGQHAEGLNKLASMQETLQREESEKQVLERTHLQQTENLQRKFEVLKANHDQGQDKLASLEDMLALEAAEKAALDKQHKAQAQKLGAKYEELKLEQNEDQVKLTSLQEALVLEAVEKETL